MSLYVGLGFGGLFMTDSNRSNPYYGSIDISVEEIPAGDGDHSDANGEDSRYYKVGARVRPIFPIYRLVGINVYLTPSLYSSISYVFYHDESSYPEDTPRFSDWGGFEISLGYEWPVVVRSNLYGLKKLYSLGFAIKYRRSVLLGHDDSNPNSRGFWVSTLYCSAAGDFKYTLYYEPTLKL